MRYSIMLQVVSLTTLILLAAAALFAWLQTRPSPQPPQRYGSLVPELLRPARRE